MWYQSWHENEQVCIRIFSNWYIWESVCVLLTLLLQKFASGCLQQALYTSPQWQSSIIAIQAKCILSRDVLPPELPREHSLPPSGQERNQAPWLLGQGWWLWGSGNEKGIICKPLIYTAWFLRSITRLMRNAQEFKGCLCLSVRNLLFVWHFSPWRCSQRAVSAQWIQWKDSLWECPRGNKVTCVVVQVFEVWKWKNQAEHQKCAAAQLQFGTLTSC